MNGTETQEKQDQQQKPADAPKLVDPKGAPVDEKVANPGKRRRFLFIGGIILLIALAAGAYYWIRSEGREETDDAQIDAHVTSISPRVGGTVIDVEANDNQNVKAGQVLVKLDPTDYQVALDRAQADLADAQASARAAQTNVPVTSTQASSGLQTAQGGLAGAQASLAASREQVNAAEAGVGSARAKVAEAQANYDKAAKDLARYAELVQKDEISRQQYDAAAANAEALRATVASQQAALAQAEQNVAVARSNVGQAQARVAQSQAEVRNAGTVPQQVAIQRARAGSAEAAVQRAQAAVERAKLDLQYTIIKAPLDGTIGNRRVDVGNVVAPNQQLMTLVPLYDVYVTANFKETQLKKMRVGQPVEISVDALGGRKFRAHVDSISPATGARFSLLPPENATGNYVKVVQRVPVKIVFEKGEDPQHLLRPGMSVEPTVFVNQ